jgi:hypothetical protein
MQRSSRDKSRARDSLTGSDMISSGCTARAADAANAVVNKTNEIAISFRISSLSLIPTKEPYSAACKPRIAFAGFGAPTRSRRSDSDSMPPNAIRMGPNQISNTSGLW